MKYGQRETLAPVPCGGDRPLGAYLLALTLTACASDPEHPPWQCNQNYVCDPDENQVSCPDDCVWSEATAEGPRADVCALP